MDINQVFKGLVEHYDLTTIGAILTFLTVVATFWKQVGEPLYNATIRPIARLFYSIYESPTKLEVLGTKIDTILSELKPNGGSSLKDQLNRLEAHVSISEAQRRLLMDSSPQGIWTSTVKGRCVWINETFRQKVEAQPEELYGDNWVSCIHPVDRKQVMDEWESAIKDGRTFNLFYRVINLKTQTPIPVHGIATPAKNFDGSIVGYNGIIYFL